MVKKISLILAGGVSLGSYEAGVITELLYAIEFANKQAGKKLYEIDVITGASAGSITAALIAKIILHDYESLKGILHESWVKKADIDKLMEGDSPNSILSNDFLFNLARDYLQRSGSSNPAICAPEILRCGFSLSNQVGIDYGKGYQHLSDEDFTTKHFISTFFSDHIEFVIQKGAEDEQSLWEKITKAAVASGSFPLAFPPVFLERRKQHYQGALSSSTDFLPEPIGNVDGGVFNNEPLKLSLRLSTEQDGGILSKDRIFLLIDPNANRSLQDQKFTSPQPLHLNVLRLIQMVMGEAHARDWMKMEAVNEKIHWCDAFILEFPNWINQMPLEKVKSEIKAYNGQIKGVKESKKKHYDLSVEEESHFSRFRRYYSKVYSKIKGNGEEETSQRASLLDRMIFISNFSANLEGKFPAHFYVISTDSTKTMGDPLFNFGGFFKEEWREHDYRLGRTDGYAYYSKIFSQYPKENDAPYNPLYDPDPKWGRIREETLADTSRKKRVAFANLLTEKGEMLLQGDPLNLSYVKLMIAKMMIKNIIRSQLLIDDRAWYKPWSWFSSAPQAEASEVPLDELEPALE